MEIGKKVEDFSLQNSEGDLVSLSSFKGKKVVLYFYPKDLTPGCTIQALAFKERYQEIVKSNAVVIGISKDSVQSHANFISKKELPFILLSDPDLAVIKKFGVWKEKKMYGKSFLGIKRTTFILNEKQEIEKIFDKVKPDNNALEVLEFLKENK